MYFKIYDKLPPQESPEDLFLRQISRVFHLLKFKELVQIPFLFFLPVSIYSYLSFSFLFIHLKSVFFSLLTNPLQYCKKISDRNLLTESRGTTKGMGNIKQKSLAEKERKPLRERRRLKNTKKQKSIKKMTTKRGKQE